MDEAEAIGRAWEVVRARPPSAEAVTGVKSARFVSPSQLMAGYGGPRSKSDRLFAEQPDRWVVHFALLETPGLSSIPDTLCVYVVDATGEAYVG